MTIKVYEVTVTYFLCGRSKVEAETALLRANKLLPNTIKIEDVTSIIDMVEIEEKDVPF